MPADAIKERAAWYHGKGRALVIKSDLKETGRFKAGHFQDSGRIESRDRKQFGG